MKLKSATIFTEIYLIHYDIVHLVIAHYRVSFSIHNPISDRVSRLLLKIVQRIVDKHSENWIDECRVWYRNVEFLTCLKSTLPCTFTDLKHNHIQITSFYHSPDRASYLDVLLARSENNSTWATVEWVRSKTEFGHHHF